MKRFLVILLIVAFFFLSRPALSQIRYAACDLCGYCPYPNVTPPSNWESCCRCLYPGASNSCKNPESNETLKIDTNTNLPPSPFPGNQYTIIGCINTKGGFQQEGAAASVTQVLLNIIFGVIGGISLLYVVYGSFVILMSQSEVERLNYGKRLIYGAVIGLIFTLLSAFIVNFVASGILKIPGF